MIFTFIIAFLIRPNGWLFNYTYDLKENILALAGALDILTIISIMSLIIVLVGIVLL